MEIDPGCLSIHTTETVVFFGKNVFYLCSAKVLAHNRGLAWTGEASESIA